MDVIEKSWHVFLENMRAVKTVQEVQILVRTALVCLDFKHFWLENAQAKASILLSLAYCVFNRSTSVGRITPSISAFWRLGFRLQIFGGCGSGGSELKGFGGLG